MGLLSGDVCASNALIRLDTDPTDPSGLNNTILLVWVCSKYDSFLKGRVVHGAFNSNKAAVIVVTPSQKGCIDRNKKLFQRSVRYGFAKVAQSDNSTKKVTDIYDTRMSIQLFRDEDLQMAFKNLIAIQSCSIPWCATRGDNYNCPRIGFIGLNTNLTARWLASIASFTVLPLSFFFLFFCKLNSKLEQI